MKKHNIIHSILLAVIMLLLFMLSQCQDTPTEDGIPGFRFTEEPNQNTENIKGYLDRMGVPYGYNDTTGAFYYANEIIVNAASPSYVDSLLRKYAIPMDTVPCHCDDSLLLLRYDPADSVNVEGIVGSTSKQSMESDLNYIYYPALVPKYSIPSSAQALQKKAGKPITVAILDTGLDTSRIASYPMWTPPTISKKAEDSCAYQGSSGWNFVDSNASIADDHGHGTLVADDIVETFQRMYENGPIETGYQLMVLKVLDGTGLGDMFSGLCAMKFAIKNGADVINVSWGSTRNQSLNVTNDPMYKLICEANILFVASKGNDGTKTFNHVISDYPLPNLLAIGADDRRGFPDAVSAIFPASNQHPHILTAPPYRGDISGTSFSAAKVSGLAAYLMAKYEISEPGGVILKIHELTQPVFDSTEVHYPFKYIQIP